MSLTRRWLTEEKTFRSEPLPFFPTTTREVFDCSFCGKSDVEVLRLGTTTFCANCVAGFLTQGGVPGWWEVKGE